MDSGSLVERQCVYVCHASMNEALRFSPFSSWGRAIAHPVNTIDNALIMQSPTESLGVGITPFSREKRKGCVIQGQQ